jgi:O-methyltransferase involved in polyketide biosynthesis
MGHPIMNLIILKKILTRACSFFLVFNYLTAGGYSSAGEEVSGQKVMSARCILHGLNRSLSDTATAQLFDPEFAPLVAHITAQVEVEASHYSRDIDKKLKKVFGLPFVAQRMLFSYSALPAYDGYVLTRKVMIHRQIADAMAGGCEQFVVLGSGFDPGALLWARSQKGRTFYTIDLPESQDIMMAAIRSYQSASDAGFGMNATDLKDNGQPCVKIGDNYYSIAYDLSKGDLFSMLGAYGFVPAKKTFLLMEGLTVYLNEETIHALLKDFKVFCAKDSLALISFMQKAIENKELKNAHQEANESYQFTLPLAKTAEFMNDMGLHMERIFTSRSAVALNVGGWFFNLYYRYWLTHETDDDGVDPSTPEPYFLLKNTDQINGEELPMELYEN